MDDDNNSTWTDTPRDDENTCFGIDAKGMATAPVCKILYSNRTNAFCPGLVVVVVVLLTLLPECCYSDLVHISCSFDCLNGAGERRSLCLTGEVVMFALAYASFAQITKVAGEKLTRLCSHCEGGTELNNVVCNVLDTGSSLKWITCSSVCYETNKNEIPGGVHLSRTVLSRDSPSKMTIEARDMFEEECALLWGEESTTEIRDVFCSSQ